MKLTLPQQILSEPFGIEECTHIAQALFESTVHVLLVCQQGKVVRVMKPGSSIKISRKQ